MEYATGDQPCAMIRWIDAAAQSETEMPQGPLRPVRSAAALFCSYSSEEAARQQEPPLVKESALAFRWCSL